MALVLYTYYTIIRIIRNTSEIPAYCRSLVTGPSLRGAGERLEDVHHVGHTWASRVAEYLCVCVCAPFGKWDHLPRAPGLAIWVIPLPPNSSLRTGGRWSPQSPPGTLNSRGGGGGKGRGIAFAPHPILLSHPTRCVIRGHRLLPVDLARMHHYQRLASSGFGRSHPFFGMVLVACSWGS